jgi:fibronectin-binding autotransporter adhesin
MSLLKKLRNGCVALIALGLSLSAQAVSYYWDGTSTTANADGGAGPWNTTSNNWNDAATAGNAVTWPSTGTGNTAVFGGVVGTVTIIAGGVTANSLAFNTANYTVAGGSLTLNGTAPSITNGVVATINVSLTGTEGLTKLGDGTLILSGNNSGLSGTLTIKGATSGNNGGVWVSSTAAFGGITNVVIENKSFLNLDGSAVITSTVPFTVSGGGGAQTPPGVIRGGGGNCVINGHVFLADSSVRLACVSGTSLTLNGPVTAPVSSNRGLMIRYAANQGVIFTNTANYWEANTTLSDGSVYFYPGALPASSKLVIAGSANAWFESNGSFTRPLGTTSAGQVDMAIGFNNGAGCIIGLSARGGDLLVNFGGASTNVTWGTTAGFNPRVLGLAGANATGTLTLENPIDLNDALREINVANGSAATDAVISGTLSGTGSSGVNKTGAGTLLLTGTNTYAGLTVITNNTGTLQLGNGGTSGTLGGGPVTNNAKLVVNRSNAYNLTNLIAGTGTLLKLGAGTLTLSAANSFSGLTTISNGTLAAGCNLSLNAGNALTLSGGTFDAGSFSNSLSSLTLSTSTASMISVNTGACTLSFTGLSGTGTLAISGTLGPKTLRFGTDSTALTRDQLNLIRANTRKVYLDGNGYLLMIPDGTMVRFF